MDKEQEVKKMQSIISNAVSYCNFRRYHDPYACYNCEGTNKGNDCTEYLCAVRLYEAGLRFDDNNFEELARKNITCGLIDRKNIYTSSLTGKIYHFEDDAYKANLEWLKENNKWKTKK